MIVTVGVEVPVVIGVTVQLKITLFPAPFTTVATEGVPVTVDCPKGVAVTTENDRTPLPPEATTLASGIVDELVPLFVTVILNVVDTPIVIVELAKDTDKPLPATVPVKPLKDAAVITSAEPDITVTVPKFAVIVLTAATTATTPKIANKATTIKIFLFCSKISPPH